MKIRKHINEFLLDGLDLWLRQNGRAADADTLLGIDPYTFSWVKNGTTTANQQTIITKLLFTVQAVKRNGDKTNGVIDTAMFINYLPAEIRPKYIGNLGASSTTAIDLKTYGIDPDKVGCRAYANLGGNGYGFIVIIGSDENATDVATIDKYLPFSMGFKAADFNTGSKYGAESYLRQAGGNVYNATFCALVWKSSKPAPAVKPVNQDLPVLHLPVVGYVAPTGYTTVPAQNVTVDWETLRNKYNSKVHMHRPFLDVIEAGLRTAGNNAVADQIKSVKPETFSPFTVTFDTVNKTMTWKGARDSTSKLYFESITFNIYSPSGGTRMYLTDLAYIYSAESGISWTNVATQAIAKASKSTALIADNEYHYFFKHMQTGKVLTSEMTDGENPFLTTGVDYLFPVYPSTAKTTSINYYNSIVETLPTGSSSCTVSLIADL